MIVFDLKCGPAGHVFEAWFASSEEFERQRATGLVACPICGSEDVAKAVMAPAVGAKGNRKPEAGRNAAIPISHGSPAGGDLAPAEAKAVLAKLAEAQARALENSDYVGDDFAKEARAMHDGEIDERPIHGETTLDEARSLIEDGVPVSPLPLPVRRPKTEH